jgi:hypothetical protein
MDGRNVANDRGGFTVMTFGPTNGPTTYTTMMFEFRQEWIALFKELHSNHAELVANNCCIIDDILNGCTDPDALVDFFKFVCIVFLKYCVSF